MRNTHLVRLLYSIGGIEHKSLGFIRTSTVHQRSLSTRQVPILDKAQNGTKPYSCSQRDLHHFKSIVSVMHIHLTSPNRMFIQVEETPNPNSLKFYPGEQVLESGTVDFQDKVTASLKSPLAKSLFRIKGVKSVFFAQDFITVTKEDDDFLDWKVMKPQIFSEIMIFYTMKQPVLFDEPDVDSNIINENDSDIVKEIKQLIEDRIRPTIQEDGGDLAFVAYEDGIVKLRLQGACTSCPSSVVTLKNGIRNMLQFYIPEVKDVVQEN